MADVNLEIVSRFFSLHGFFVRSEEFMYIKRAGSAVQKESGFIYKNSELAGVQSAVVSIKPWHSEVFFPSRIRNSSDDIFKFLEKDNLKAADKILGGAGFKKILVLSKLPTSKNTLKNSVRLLEEAGVDMAVQFPDIMSFLLKNVKKNKNYSDDQVFQLLRILKACGFCGVEQPELFPR